MSRPPEPAPFSIETFVDGARTLVVLRGEIDSYTSTRLQEGIDGLGDVAGRHVVIDLAGIGFVDSTGLSSLANSLRAVRDAGGAVSMRSMTRQLAKLFEITGLTRIFPVE